ncbi:voltage-dependent anion channel 3 [Cricetulus griseus]
MAGPGSDILAGGTRVQLPPPVLRLAHYPRPFKATVAMAPARSRENLRLRENIRVTRPLGVLLRTRTRTRTRSRTVGGRVPSSPLRAGPEARHRARALALWGDGRAGAAGSEVAQARTALVREDLQRCLGGAGRAHPRVVDMCNTPTYCDLGKAAKDVFNKGYGFGMVKIDLRTKSCSGVEFSTSGHAYTDTGKASGNLETKYKVCDYGLTFTQKWNTDNTLGTEVSWENKLADGLKLTLDTIFVPNTGKKSGKLKASFRRDCFSLGSNVDIDFSGPTIYGWAVLAFEGWLAGYQMSFDTAKSKLSQNNFALGYKAEDFQLHTHVNDGTEFGGSIYQKVNEKVETSAKVNNASLIGLGYTQTLRAGVKLTLSALIDGKNFNAGGHKVGLGFELEA